MNLLHVLLQIGGLTSAYKIKLIEASSVCLESQNHGILTDMYFLLSSSDSPQDQAVSQDQVVSVERLEISPEMRTTYADEQEATEWGAVGIALALSKEHLGYQSVLRSRKGTGFDYWLGETSLTPQARLEVSGIRVGNNTQIMSRVAEKRLQATQSDDLLGHLPAIVIIVEFSGPYSFVDIRNIRTV
jgi:hypothetical protein